MKHPPDNFIPEIEVQFGHSTSQNYPKALRICKRKGNFSTKGEGKDASHSLKLPVTEAPFLSRIWGLIGHLTSAELFIQGRPAKKQELDGGALGCFQERERSKHPENFCFGYNGDCFLGCMQIGWEFRKDGSWWKKGKFDHSGRFHFDKQAMRGDIERRLEQNSICPVLDEDQIWNRFSQMPDSINAMTDPKWNYRFRWVDEWDEEMEIVGIRPTYDGEIKELGKVQKRLKEKSFRQLTTRINKIRVQRSEWKSAGTDIQGLNYPLPLPHQCSQNSASKGSRNIKQKNSNGKRGKWGLWGWVIFSLLAVFAIYLTKVFGI